MNALALPLPLSSNNSDKLIKLHLCLGAQSLVSVMDILRDHGYSPSLMKPENSTDKGAQDRHQIVIDTDIDPHWITPFTRWLLRKTQLKTLKIRLEDTQGNIIAECNLQGAGISSF